ncbi:hypothetical protein MMC15_007556 [Xylographa vitiligo]|nr:hypothetical protein [Xylographa vitiligo]
MHRVTRPELLELETAHASSNIPRDHASMSPAFSLASAPSVNPEPAYIAASAASQIVTSEYQSQHQDWEEENTSPPLNEIALVAPASLSLINAFLDRLLFNFLASARSTSLASLRPAVTEVLKPRLAKEAITGADEELQEFLGGGDDEELLDFHNGDDRQEDWDLDLVWKRTRLRCMVYTRLGDMEEEDEDMYIEQEHLEDPTAPRRLSRDIGIVSPAVAIFLTSILEFIGEHALMVAGEAAYKRCEHSFRSERRRSRGPQRVVVEEMDMEKVALNATLGRLWRSWRKLLRSPRTSISRIMARDTGAHRGLRGFSSSRSTSRKSSIGAIDDRALVTDLDRTPSVAQVLSGAEPASIPLPLADYDIDEIEVPGYSPRVTPKSGEIYDGSRGSRRFSMAVPAELARGSQGNLPSNQDSSTAFTKSILKINTSHETSNRRPRSQSLPTPTQTPFILPTEPEEAFGFHVPHDNTTVPSDAAESRSINDNETTPRLGSNVVDDNSKTNVEGANSNSTSKSNLGSPFGSVLNAISQHAARELQAPSGNASDEESQEYISEDLVKAERHRPKEVEIGGSSKYLIASLGKAREDAQTRYSTSSSVPSHVLGEVSPMDPNFVESGEVSPIDPADDENEHYFAKAASASEEGALGNTTHDLVPSTDYPRTEDVQIQDEAVQTVVPASIPRATHGRQRGMDGPTEDDYQKDGKREAFVVLEDLSALDSSRNSNASSLSGKDLQVDGTISSKKSRLPATENGVPPLTPLREMMEAAHDTSDENSSVAPSHIERSLKPILSAGQGLSSASPAISHAQTSPNGSKTSDLRRQLPSVYTGQPAQGIDRAGVQRVSPSLVGAREPLTPQGRSSDSSARDLRSLYAATSGTSPVSLKAKGKAGKNPGDNARELVPSRTSSDGSKATGDERQHRISSQSSDRQQSFEQLMNSDQTIQYTLTPQTMREIEVCFAVHEYITLRLTGHQGPESPRASSYHSPSKTTQVVNMIRSGRTSVEQPRPPTGRSTLQPVNGVNGLRSNPADTKQTLASEIGNVSAPSGTGFVIHSGPSLKRGPQPVARDARVENENTRDFADFIRSTGPEQTKSLPKPPMARPTSGPRPQSAVNGVRPHRTSQSTVPRTVGKTTSGLNPIIAPLISENKLIKKGGPRLQARDATISRGDETSDLIDFIRQGPPGERTEGNHRIPRTVAPFRNTMDSDDIRNLMGKAKDTNSVASIQDSSFTKSLHSSVNSRTGLLDSSNRQTPKVYPQPAAEKRPARYEDPIQPMRKQRRVRDPYAIDFDSDGDDESHTPKPQQKEESLLDFLNSVPPPQASNSPPPLDVSRSMARKTSTSVRSRFTRSSSSSTAIKQPPINSLPPNTANTTNPSQRVRNDAARSPSYGVPREDSSQSTQQPHSKFDTYKSTSPTNGVPMGRPRGAVPKSPGRPIQARPAARDDIDSMRDLADFLKNSGPPEPPIVTGAGRAYGRSGVPEKEEGGGFSRMFSRRKRGAGVA